MATSKTLTPTNVTIQIPEFTDQPDQRVNSNCIDKEADAINALNSKIANQAFDKVNSTSINDLNSDIPNGLYEYGANSSNAPTTNGGVVLHCLIAYKNHGFQIAHANNQSYLSYRWKSADTWSAWKSLT